MYRKKQTAEQQTLWIPTSEIVTSSGGSFYQKLDEALKSFEFSRQVDELCRRHYSTDAEKGGRPGIDPVVYFKMLMVGFFEGIPSERGIASRCADSLSIRSFLHYELTEATPHHSSMTVIRQRLGSEVYQGVFAIILRALQQHKLLRALHVGIDGSTMEASASMRSLKGRMTGQSYTEYVKGLAEESGIDPEDAAAVRRFDRKRPGRKTSNDDWENPHDPDAKVGRTKRGTTRMIYKPEHVVDLETGAILDVDVRPGDEGDTEELSERVLDIEEQLNDALGRDSDAATIETLTADKGYYMVDELAMLQHYGIRTVVSDPIENRRLEKLHAGQRAAVESAKKASGSKRGKKWLRRRGELVERSFTHVLDNGGARRTTLRGGQNIRKRYVIQAMACNLSLLLRKLIGVGTPKQAIARGFAAILSMIHSYLQCLLAPHGKSQKLKQMFIRQTRTR